MIGSGLIILGMLSGFVSHYYSEAQNDSSKYLTDGLAYLLAKNQLGNVYIEALRLELRDKGISRQAKALAGKALLLNPKDRQALEYFAAIGALGISRLEWMTGFNRKKYDAIRAAESQKIRKIVVQGMKLYPTSHVFHDALGILLDAEGKHEEARKEFMISGRLRSDPYWKEELAVSWALSKNHRKALEALESARLNGATGALFSFYYGRALHAMGECDRAEIEFQKSRREYRRLPELLKAISDFYFDQGRFLLASKFSLLTGFSLIRISWISTLINFRDAFLGLFLTVMCFISKKLWVVIRWIPLLRAIQQRFLPPDEPEISLVRRSIEQGYWVLAEKHLRTVCKILPHEATNYGKLAITLFRQGKVKEAIEVNAIALSIEPENRIFKHNKEAFEMGKFEDGSNIVWDAKRGKYPDL